MDIFFYHLLSHWTLSAKWMYKKRLHIITYCIWLWRLGKILKSAPQKWKKLPISRAKNDRESSIFFRSRSQKKRLKIRSKSDLVSRVKRDWKSDRKRIVRSDFDLFWSSSSLLWFPYIDWAVLKLGRYFWILVNISQSMWNACCKHFTLIG